MRVTTRGRQAVTAMIDVGLNQKAGPVALAGVARRQQISISYLEQMFAELRNHGLVRSTRGPGGGYVIARSAQAISVAEVVVAVDRGIFEANYMGVAMCEEAGERCLTPELWNSLGQRMFEFLSSVHLQNLIDVELAGGTQTVEVRPIRRRLVAIPAQLPVPPNGPNSVFDLGKLVVV